MVRAAFFTKGLAGGCHLEEEIEKTMASSVRRPCTSFAIHGRVFYHEIFENVTVRDKALCRTPYTRHGDPSDPGETGQ